MTFSHSQKALVRTVFLREHISGNRLLSLMNMMFMVPLPMSQSILTPLNSEKSVCDCGKALREYICSDDLHMVLSATKGKLDLTVLHKVVLELVSLTALPMRGSRLQCEPCRR